MLPVPTPLGPRLGRKPGSRGHRRCISLAATEGGPLRAQQCVAGEQRAGGREKAGLSCCGPAPESLPTAVPGALVPGEGAAFLYDVPTVHRTSEREPF